MRMLGDSRIRTLGVAAVVAFALLLAFRQLGGHGMYSSHGAYRAQVDAFLAGRLALTPAPEGLAHDLAWTPTGVQQVWGLGVPLWQTPFELGARAVGQEGFPDRIAMALWLALVFLVLLRALGARKGEPWWIGAGSVLITALLPAFITILRGRLGVYEEAAIYSYGAAMILLGGLVLLGHRPTRSRYLLLLLVAGLTGLIRPTVWFYGLSTAIVGSIIYIQSYGRRALPHLALGFAMFAVGGAALYVTNTERFGSGAEFGHRLNIHSLPGNIVATRFSYPFERVGWVEAGVELLGSLVDRPETAAKRDFYAKGLHAGQSDEARWREYYFTTYSWPYVPLVLAGLALGVRAWRRSRRERSDSDWCARWLLPWAVLGALPLFVFYLHSPSVSSRYQLDLGPAVAALLLIAWREGATWVTARGRGALAFAILVGLWATAVVTSKTRGRVKADPTDRETALATSWALSRPATVPRAMPASYQLGDPWIASQTQPRPHGLYLNGIGWDAATGRVPPATHFFVSDPKFLELDVESATGAPIDWRTEVRVAPGISHFHLASVETTARGAHLRFESVLPVNPGLHVLFIAFGPDTELDRSQSDVILKKIRWRD
ncbi:MAG: hypothetical protein H0T42_17080 [Deltaproteobacteria bacterium]|nr:hypothetical protein [Deltaproteobacteria bacterium]